MPSWYLNRLGSMSAREIPYRFSQLIRKKYEEYFCAGRKLPEIPVPETSRILDNQISDKYIFPAEIDIFGKILNYSKSEINWHSDIFSGKSFPLIISKKSIYAKTLFFQQKMSGKLTGYNSCLSFH